MTLEPMPDLGLLGSASVGLAGVCWWWRRARTRTYTRRLYPRALSQCLLRLIEIAFERERRTTIAVAAGAVPPGGWLLEQRADGSILMIAVAPNPPSRSLDDHAA